MRIDDRYLNLGQQRPQASRHELEEAVGAALVGTAVRVRRGRRSGMRDRAAAMREAWGLGAAALLAVVAAGLKLQPVRGGGSRYLCGQVAPILYARCTTCHHPGGAGPFTLLTYKDAQRWGAANLDRHAIAYMPLWLPEPGFGQFGDDRCPPDKEREVLLLWVAAGMPRGEMASAPPVPVYSGEGELGTPDLVLEMPQAFTHRRRGRMCPATLCCLLLSRRRPTFLPWRFGWGVGRWCTTRMWCWIVRIVPAQHPDDCGRARQEWSWRCTREQL